MHDRDAIHTALNGRYQAVYEALGSNLRPLGGELRGPCPLHGGQGQNFTVNQESGNWYCHSQCATGGDIFDFVQRAQGCSFVEALEWLADFAGMVHSKPHRRTNVIRLDKRPAAVSLDNQIAQDCHGRLLGNPRMLAWLKTHRCWSEETILRFQIGVFQDGAEWRVTIPIRNTAGDLVNIRKYLPEWKPGMERSNKTLPWKSGLTSGLFPLAAIRGTDWMLLVEGEPDAILACQLGFPAITGTLGAGNWRPEWTDTLRAKQRAVILYDNDEAGRSGASIVANALVGAVTEVYIASIPEACGKDLSEWVVDHGATSKDLQNIIDNAMRVEPEPSREASAVTGGDWEAPIPITAHDLPTFPIEALPESIAPYVTDTAETIQVPIDLPAMLSIPTMATAVAPKCDIQVGPSHIEPLPLWAACVLPSGERKSAAMDTITRPLSDAERDMEVESRPARNEARERRQVEEKQAAALREKAAKADPDVRESLMSELYTLSGNRTEEITEPRLLADDTTPERLVGLLAEQNGCIAIFSPEGGIFSILAGRYNDKSKVNLDAILKAHAGDPIRVDRVGRPPQFIPRPMLSMGLAVQPDVLRSLSETREFRGRGLLGRYMYSIPKSLVGTRLSCERTPDRVACADYHRAIRSVLSLRAPTGDPGARHRLTLSPAARAVWVEGADEIELRQAAGCDLAGIRDWASKLAGAVARMAGAFHVVRYAGDAVPWSVQVGEYDMMAGWAIGQYLIPHALAAYGEIGAEPELTLARRVLDWIGRNGTSRFSLRDCHQFHRDTKPTDIQTALDILVNRGYIRPAETSRQGGAGRKPSPRYEVNPHTHNSQNTRN